MASNFTNQEKATTDGCECHTGSQESCKDFIYFPRIPPTTHKVKSSVLTQPCELCLQVDPPIPREPQSDHVLREVLARTAQVSWSWVPMEGADTFRQVGDRMLLCKRNREKTTGTALI